MKPKISWEHIRHIIRKESSNYRQQQKDLIFLGKQGWESYFVHVSEREDIFFMKRATVIKDEN